MHANEPKDPIEQQRQWLSALMDGDAAAADPACHAWRGEGQARADWHAYHLIGEVLRGDEHRCDAAHDARFVARLRERLMLEAVPLAPRRPATPRVRRAGMWRTWTAPAAVAA